MLRALLLAGTSLAMLGACAQNMMSGEYWVDSDPGWGQGTPITGMPAQSNIPAHQFTVLTDTLTPGIHIIGIRTKDANGRWSITNLEPVYVNAAPETADIVRTVYFWNTDAGWSSGTDAGIDGGPIVSGTVSASLAGTATGINNLFVRSVDANGHWSLTNTTPVYVDVPDVDATIVRTEYFWNNDPGWGSGTSAALAGQPDVNGVVSASSADAVSGINNLFVRSKDAHGHWSLTNKVPVYAEAAPTGEIMAAESFWDEDPGFGVGDPIGGWIVSADTSGEFQVHVPSNIGWGHHLLYVRTLDQHGHWSLTNWAVDSVFVDPTDLGDLTAQTGISVYPNPFAETVTVQPAEAKPLRVILYDPQGKLVYDKILMATTNIDLNGMVAGAYTAFFWQDQERIHRTTLIKQ